MPLRALFLASYPVRAASTRFRATQFFPALGSYDIECGLSPFLPDHVFADFYRKGRAARKALQLALLAARRLVEVARAGRWDVVVVQRESMLVGPPLVEWLLRRILRKPMVYDYDDAIWVSRPSPTWGSLAALAKFPAKTAAIVRMANHVIVCNDYTRDYALRFRRPGDVTVIPTVVDTNEFKPRPRRNASTPVIGWIGTHSTAPYLETIRPVLESCARHHRFRLKIVGAGRDFAFHGIETENKPWRLEDEVADYQSLDIGLYPVEDDEWGRGKTGFKPVVYMACGVACVCSPVGGVTEFLVSGKNGLFASTPGDWEQAIDVLLSDRDMRHRLGAAGRETVVNEYSVQRQAPRLAHILHAVAGERGR
ncbi:MAG: glycosyltransferase family 4 protein [Candidatus Rokubacteria bacterium]|nr:glycosyltransferase family 4 protein [Candidatus Rokubacteria bacterium]